MELLLLGIAAAGGVGVYAARRISGVREERRRRAEQLQQVRQVADEDVTVFGDQLRRLDSAVGERELDEDGRHDYQTALDAYERAKWDAPRMEQIEEISALVDTLATGRYAMACVRARLDGQPLPELRVPCFFNPQHGPSASDVRWTSTRFGTRRVPACSRCAHQLEQRQKPEVRTVTIGARTVPYWEAGGVMHPYSRGYFAADAASTTYAATTAGAMAWLYASPDVGSTFNGGAYDGGHSGVDWHGGFDGGGFDGGGGDGGGGF